MKTPLALSSPALLSSETLWPHQSEDHSQIGQAVALYEQLAHRLEFEKAPNPSDPHIHQELARVIKALAGPWSPEDAAALMAHPTILGLRAAVWAGLSSFEHALDDVYSQKVDETSLHDFPYHKKYAQLVNAELALLGLLDKKVSMPKHESIAILGAGSFPLSAVLMHQKTQAPITCLDEDPHAVELGRRFLRRCGVAAKAVRYQRLEVGKTSFEHHPILFLGHRMPHKKEILLQAKDSRPIQQIGVRTALGLYSLLYEPINRQLDKEIHMTFNRKTLATSTTLLTTLFFVAIQPVMFFEKEEPKPDRGDIWWYPPSPHCAHG